MVRIRAFEARVVELVNANEIAGVTHEYVGEEAVAVGICSALTLADGITSTHRGHGHLLAKGGTPDRMLAELMGRDAGYNRGRGGSMHIADVSVGVYGANGMVGAGAPIACGLAFRYKYAGSDQIAVSFFGDGAINQGVVLESLNLAAIWKLPVVFVCENNQYAQTTPVGSMSILPLYRRAEGFGMPAMQIDGMDVESVRAAAVDARKRAMRGDGPTFLECTTYRYVGHQTAERMMNLRYRTDQEVEEWRLRDPIKAWAHRLGERGLMTSAHRAEIDADVAREIDDATAFARGSDWPLADSVLEFMYATPVDGAL